VEGAKPFLAMLDTGTPGILIPTSVGATLRTTGQKRVNVRHADGKIGQAIQAGIPKLRVGDAELRGVGALFIAPESPPEFNRNMAVLGMGFLRYFRVTLSYAKKRIALTPLAATGGEP
jgi:hypothetical protein